jgi:hypothetical protein
MNVIFEVLTTVPMEITTLWDVVWNKFTDVFEQTRENYEYSSTSLHGVTPQSIVLLLRTSLDMAND